MANVHTFGSGKWSKGVKTHSDHFSAGVIEISTTVVISVDGEITTENVV